MKTTLDGKKAGLQDAKSMKQENEDRRKKESKMLDGVRLNFLLFSFNTISFLRSFYPLLEY